MKICVAFVCIVLLRVLCCFVSVCWKIAFRAWLVSLCSSTEKYLNTTLIPLYNTVRCVSNLLQSRTCVRVCVRACTGIRGAQRRCGIPPTGGMTAGRT